MAQLLRFATCELWVVARRMLLAERWGQNPGKRAERDAWPLSPKGASQGPCWHLIFSERVCSFPPPTSCRLSADQAKEKLTHQQQLISNPKHKNHCAAGSSHGRILALKRENYWVIAHMLTHTADARSGWTVHHLHSMFLIPAPPASRQRHHPLVPRSVPIFHSYVTRRSRPTESSSHVNFTRTKQLFVHTWEGELFWSVCALWKLLPDSQVISFVLQTFQKMPDIHSTGPSALIHFKECQGPFDFQYSTAERKAEVRLVFEHV